MQEKSKTVPIIAGIAAVIVIAGGVYVFTKDDKKTDTKTSTTTTQTQSTAASKDIVDTAVGTAPLSTLVTAVKAASLVDTLKGSGPFTVFAPTNDAFAALPSGTLDSLLKPENVEQLKKILTYHVVAGNAKAADLKDGQTLTTVQGGTLTVKIMGSTVEIVDAKGNAATVTSADVATKNGTVHVINKVLLP